MAQYLGAYEVDSVEDIDTGVKVSLKEAGEECLSKQDFDALVKPEASDHAEYTYNKRMLAASAVYQTLVRHHVPSMDEAKAVLIAASQEMAQRFDRICAVKAFGKQDEKEDISLPEIESNFRATFEK